MKIKIFANTKKEKVRKSLPKLKKIVGKSKTAATAGNFDTAFVLGGDGWLLKTLAEVYKNETDIFFFPMGENTQTVGFNLKEAKKIISGNLKTEVYHPLFLCGRHIAFNDIVIKTGKVARTIKCRLKARKEVFEWEGDGAIISTPLGSTAYNFAAGGPVVEKKIDAVVVTPMMSFVGLSQSIVFPFSKPLEISIIEKQGDVWEIYDGTEIKPAAAKIKIVAKRSACKIHFPK